ncbi:hypothetical protein QTP88_018041 [Uroleucon formosanum]
MTIQVASFKICIHDYIKLILTTYSTTFKRLFEVLLSLKSFLLKKKKTFYFCFYSIFLIEFLPFSQSPCILGTVQKAEL